MISSQTYEARENAVSAAECWRSVETPHFSPRRHVLTPDPASRDSHYHFQSVSKLLQLQSVWK